MGGASPANAATAACAAQVPRRGAVATGKVMPLVLSAKNSEGFRDQVVIKNTKTFPEFIKMAKDAGYDGIHLRASLGGLQTPLGELYAMSAQLKAAGLSVSSVSPDFPVPINNDHAPDCLHNITPYLAFAAIFDCDMIRVGMKKEADIPWAQRAADEARERNMRLVHHAESFTLFENFALALRTLKAINRPNFGLQHDEAQWLANTPDYREDRIIPNIKAMAPWLWEVFIKNNPGGKGSMVRPEIKLDAPGGVNFEKVFEGLYAIGYKGWIQVHEGMDSYGGNAQLAAVESYKYLKRFTDRAAKA
jgi:sugar phosphate isomerase/epimerase